MKTFPVLSFVTAMLLFAAAQFFAATAYAAQFSSLDPNYNQQIFAAPLQVGQEAGMAWTSGGNLLTRAGSNIIEHNLTQNVVVNGTNVHGVTVVHPITSLSTTGYGMTKGFDGKIYTVTSAGLERFDPNNWATAATLMPGSIGGPGWGVTTMSDGRIAYSDSANIYAYNPVTFTNTLLYTSTSQVDDIEASPTGKIAITGHSSPFSITVITNSGAPLITFPTPHAPDGLAFGDGSTSPNMLFSNNNDGSITRYKLSPGYTSLLSTTDIATNLPQTYPVGGAYGDLASVGPDCAFYVTQYENGGSNGSTPGVGTHWDNGTTTTDGSIIRIAMIGSDGLEVCGFDSTNHPTPEPSSFVLAGLGAIGVWLASRRRRMKA